MRPGFRKGLFAGFLAGALITAIFGPSSAMRAGKKLFKISGCLKKKRDSLIKRIKEKE
ncbi:MAG: hypothetical protein L5655_09585 [Thermosediminibacteraceae bacterium]|nr:hypothetical protein [Thermosediminibacteraceae bacterium]